MKQLGTALIQYTQEYDEKFPITRDYGSLTDGKGWDERLGTYVGQKPSWGATPLVFACPSDSIERASGGSTRSYAINRYIEGPQTQVAPPSWASATWPGLSLAEFTAPSSTFSLVEMPWQHSLFGNTNGSVCKGPGDAIDTVQTSESYQSAGSLTPLHLETYNYLFVDGHVKSIRPETTIGSGGTLTAPKGAWTMDAND